MAPRTPALEPGQSKMDVSIDKHNLGKVSVTYKTRASIADEPNHLGMVGIDTDVAQRYVNAMIDAAKLVDAEIYAEQHEDATLILTPIYAVVPGKIVEKRLMLNDDEFVPIGVRDPREDDDLNGMEKWQ